MSGANAREDEATLHPISGAEETPVDQRLKMWALQSVVDLAILLSAERDFTKLLERILIEAKSLCHADAGTLYLLTDDRRLQFMIMRNDTMGLAVGGTTGQEVTFAPLELYDPESGEPRCHLIAVQVALSGETVNIPDAYQAEGYDFSGTRAFDRQTGYHSQSFLTLPLKNAQERVIGVLQLINALDAESGQIIPFDAEHQQIVEALATLAAIVLTSYLQEQQLRAEIAQLRVAVDQERRARQVAVITETEYFRRLRTRARELRRRHRASQS